MAASRGNIFGDVPAMLPEEQFSELLATPGVWIERIVSNGQSTPPGQWLDQEQAEWVMIVQGSARLRFDGEAEARWLRPGDYVYIPPHARHRVDWTEPDRPTVWLAIHWR